MEQYKLPSHINPDKVFIVNRSELEGRIDPEQYHSERIVAIEKLKKNNTLKKLRETVFNVKTIISDIHETDIYVGLENIVSDTGEYLPTKEKTQISSAGVFKKGQILFPKLRPYLNKVYLTEFDGICSTEFHIFDGKGIDNTALAIYLRSNLIVAQTKHLMTGNTLPRLQTEDINNLPIPNRLYEYQQQIVDLYQEAYNKKQQKEAEAKALLDSVDIYLLSELGITLPQNDNSLQKRVFTTQLSEVTGGRFDAFFNQEYYSLYIESTYSSVYKNEKLKNLISLIESGSRPTGGVSNIEGGILSLGGEHVNSNCEIEIKNPKYIPIEFHEKIKNTETKLYDILLVKDGATTGKTGIIEDENYVCQNINEHVFLIRTNENVNSYFLAYMLHSNMMQIQIGRGITGATVTGLTKDVVKNLQIPLPPLEKQDEIAQHIQSIREQAKQLQNDAKAILEQAKQEVEKMILG